MSNSGNAADDLLNELVSKDTKPSVERAAPDVSEPEGGMQPSAEPFGAAAPKAPAPSSRSVSESSVGAPTTARAETRRAPVAKPSGAEEPPAGPLTPDRTGQETAEVAGVALDIGSMASYDWSPAPHDPLTVAVRLARGSGPGHWSARVEWPTAPSAGVVLYRVLVADGEAPPSDCDDMDATLSVRLEPHALDDTSVNQPLAAFRTYEVWVYSGKDVADAASRPPYLYATGSVVWPPLELEVMPDNGQLIGKWQHMDGALYRWVRQTALEAHQGMPSPDLGIEVREPGFVDQSAVPGVDYVYAVFAGAKMGHGIEWSDVPGRVKSALPVRLDSVMDLEVTVDPVRAGIVHLEWTPPRAGSVDIYRSLRPLSADIHNAGEVDLEILRSDEYRLGKEDRLRNPIQVRKDGRRARMANVAIPLDGAEIYFTPVTRAGKRGTPGKPVTLLQPMPPGSPYLEDRVDWVLVVFEWPSGSSKVNLYVSGPGGTVDLATARPLASILEEEARSFGGFQIPREQFAVGPCTLHLVGYNQHAGQEAYSPVVCVDHTFPVLVRYRFVRRSAMLRGTKVSLQLSSREGAKNVRLALMWSDDGLPLAREDGRLLATWVDDIPDDAHPEEPRSLKDRLKGASLPSSGYLRLLADPGSNVALLDPPAGNLQLKEDESAR